MRSHRNRLSIPKGIALMSILLLTVALDGAVPLADPFPFLPALSRTAAGSVTTSFPSYVRSSFG